MTHTIKRHATWADDCALTADEKDALLDNIVEEAIRFKELPVEEQLKLSYPMAYCVPSENKYVPQKLIDEGFIPFTEIGDKSMYDIGIRENSTVELLSIKHSSPSFDNPEFVIRTTTDPLNMFWADYKAIRIL